MKKRIKLTDKELAIGMWVYICLYIESYNDKLEEHETIVYLKKKWLEKHYKKSYKVSPFFCWEHDCYLCSKYLKSNCLACPLGNCGVWSLYEGVTEYYYNKEYQNKALGCAKKILGVIQREVEDEDN